MSLTVDNICSKNIVTVKYGCNVKSAAQIMAQHKISSVVVLKEKVAAGIVTERDMVQKIIANGLPPEKTKVEAIMSKPLIAVKPTTTIREAAILMKNRRIKKVLVVDGKKIAGILSETDILAAYPSIKVVAKKKSKS
ncbi:cyclic nucleotide-binding/CBS domain-containing protein [Candidatus Altiarchaeota archaeon]